MRFYVLTVTCIALLIITRMMQEYTQSEKEMTTPSTVKTASLYNMLVNIRTFYASYSVKVWKKSPEGNQMCNVYEPKQSGVLSTKNNVLPDENIDKNSAIVGYKNSFEAYTVSGRFLLIKIQCFLSQTRGRIAKLYQDSLPNTHASLAFWVVFGYDTTSSNTLIVTLRRLGVSDMVVASGYQVAYVCALISTIFSKKNSILHVGMRMCFLWIYVCIVGFQASIVRAAFSRSFLELAAVSGKKFRSGWALFLSGAVMLLIKPAFLFSLGFQFSFLISASFLLFSSREEYTLSSFTAPVLAWFVTLPIEFARGDTVFLSSILAEIALLWVCPVLMTSSVIHLFLAWIPGIRIISTALLYACTTVYLEIMQQILSFFDTLPLEIKPIPMVYTAWLLIFLVMVYKRFFQRKTRKYRYFHPD